MSLQKADNAYICELAKRRGRAVLTATERGFMEVLKNDCIEKKLVHLDFINRENGFLHHSYDDDMRVYELLRAGDMDAIRGESWMLSGKDVGHLSNDLLRNQKYLFVAATTLATRYAIQGGLTSETAYNLSDIFINLMDECTAPDEVEHLHIDMLREFTRRVAGAKCSSHCRYSKPVSQTLDYIYLHLQEPFSVEDCADSAGLNRSYLSALFKREVGVTVSDYIRLKRIEAAKNMLSYSEFSLEEISSYLAFTSQSHFVSVFKKYVGITPGAYRRRHGGNRRQGTGTQATLPSSQRQERKGS